LQLVIGNPSVRIGRERWEDVSAAAYPALLSYSRFLIRGRIRRWIEAEDLAHEAFLEACRRSHRFRGTTVEEFSRWVRRIALHKVRNLRRTHRYQKRSEDRCISIEELRPGTFREPEAREPDPLRAAEERELFEAIKGAIRRLGLPESLLVTAIRLEGVPVRCLASLLKVSDSALYKRVDRALDQVRSTLRLAPRKRWSRPFPGEGTPIADLP